MSDEGTTRDGGTSSDAETMRAVAVAKGESTPRLVRRERPTPTEGEVLVRILRVGIDGTDHEVVSGGHGGFPEGADELVLGHEAVGVVEDPNGTDLESGQYVVPTVRRPPPGQETNEYFERGEPDVAPDGAYVERGIVGAHGYMAEYVTSRPEFLVPVPESIAEYAFLVEPLSNAVKALELATVSRSTFHWGPESAIVLGNGPLGLLSLALLDEDERFERLYCLGRRDRPDPTIDVMERLGATYVDSRETPVADLADAHEPMDLVLEATGYAPHAFDLVEALAPRGVGGLLGIPPSDRFEIDGGALHRDVVLQNKAVFGSVNSHVPHFERARETIESVPDWFVDELVTGVYDPADVADAFEDDAEGIKTVVEFDSS